MSRYAIYLNGNHTACPKCSGMMRTVGNGVDFRCNDCNSFFRCVGTYKAPRALMYELIEPKKGANA